MTSSVAPALQHSAFSPDQGKRYASHVKKQFTWTGSRKTRHNSIPTTEQGIHSPKLLKTQDINKSFAFRTLHILSTHHTTLPSTKKDKITLNGRHMPYPHSTSHGTFRPNSSPAEKPTDNTETPRRNIVQPNEASRQTDISSSKPQSKSQRSSFPSPITAVKINDRKQNKQATKCGLFRINVQKKKAPRQRESGKALFQSSVPH